MPELQKLAASGTRTTARVEALIPSTIAGVRAEVEGIVAPPGSFVFDFASGAAPAGGFLAVNRQRGGHSFVAAPRIWGDLYGAWIDESVATSAIDGEDQRLLEAALRQLSQGGCNLVVVHLSRPDVAAHLSGGRSPRYLAAAAWCDRAVGQLVRAAGPETEVVVTADHGVSRSGGHAGPEEDVLRIPLVVAGPGAPRLPVALRQVEIAGLVEGMLGAPPAAGAGVSIARRSPMEWVCFWVVAAMATSGTVMLLSAVKAARRNERRSGCTQRSGWSGW